VLSLVDDHDVSSRLPCPTSIVSGIVAFVSGTCPETGDVINTAASVASIATCRHSIQSSLIFHSVPGKLHGKAEEC